MKRAKAKFWFYLMTVTSSIYILWLIFFTLPIGLGLESKITRRRFCCRRCRRSCIRMWMC